MPRDLTILADLKARRGHVAAAKALYEQAEDVIEGMLIGVDQPYWNSSVAAAMSQPYVQHFELATIERDTPGAFRVLERIRGRTLAWALKDRKAFPQTESGETTSLESGVAGLQARLLQTNSAIEREQLLDKLVEYERRLGLAWTQGDALNRRRPTEPAPLIKVQHDLKSDEVLLEYVLDDPNFLLHFNIAKHGKCPSTAGWTQGNRAASPAICPRNSRKGRWYRNFKAALSIARESHSGNSNVDPIHRCTRWDFEPTAV